MGPKDRRKAILTTPGFLGTVRGAHQNGDYECKTGVIV
jgi:hypothetical protein